MVGDSVSGPNQERKRDHLDAKECLVDDLIEFKITLETLSEKVTVRSTMPSEPDSLGRDGGCCVDRNGAGLVAEVVDGRCVSTAEVTL